MYRGDDRDFPFTITKGGVAYDLTTASVVFTAKLKADLDDADAEAAFSLTSDEADITIDADQEENTGNIIVHVPATATVDLTDGTTYLCDVEVTDGGLVFTWPEALEDQSALIRLKVRLDVTTP